MFQRLLNDKPSAEAAAPPSLAPTPVAAQDSELNLLRECRTTCQVEIDVLQGQLEKANEGYRTLRKKHTKDLNWEEANVVSGALPRIYPGSSLARTLVEAKDRCDLLRTAIDEKVVEVERLTKLIQSIERELPGRLRREALQAALPFAFEFIDALCVAARHEAEYISLGGHVEQSIPWEFALAGGEGVEVQTVMSRWLKALEREGIRIPGDISDDSRHLAAPASVHARVQTDAGYAGHHAQRGAEVGFKKGFMTHARNY